MKIFFLKIELGRVFQYILIEFSKKNSRTAQHWLLLPWKRPGQSIKICVKFCTLAKSKNELPPSQRIILEKIQKSPENFLRVPPPPKKGGPLFRLCDPIVAGFPVSIHLGIIHTSIHPSILWLTSPVLFPFLLGPLWYFSAGKLQLKNFAKNKIK
jgi:hypothetical protein